MDIFGKIFDGIGLFMYDYIAENGEFEAAFFYGFIKFCNIIDIELFFGSFFADFSASASADIISLIAASHE